MGDDEIIIPDYVPSSISLPPTREFCPKCRTEAGYADREFHFGGIFGSTPCGQVYGLDDLKTLGEHICVTCGKCGYFWSERVGNGG